MKSKLFYEGHLMGEFDSPVETSLNYICWHCGRTFAKRVCDNPFTWKVSEGACGKCGFNRQVNSLSLVYFHQGGELLDHIKRPLLDFVQFLYEADIAIGPEKHEYTEPNLATHLRRVYGFSGPEHTWAKGPFDGGFWDR